jgi:hypothetical protein
MNKMFLNASEQKRSDLESILRDQKEKRGIPTRDARLPPESPDERKEIPASKPEPRPNHP